MNNNTVPVKVTLRPTHIKMVKRVAKETGSNFSLALRNILDEYKSIKKEKLSTEYITMLTEIFKGNEKDKEWQ